MDFYDKIMAESQILNSSDVKVPPGMFLRYWQLFRSEGASREVKSLQNTSSLSMIVQLCGELDRVSPGLQSSSSDPWPSHHPCLSSTCISLSDTFQILRTVGQITFMLVSSDGGPGMFCRCSDVLGPLLHAMRSPSVLFLLSSIIVHQRRATAGRDGGNRRTKGTRVMRNVEAGN